MEQIAEYLANLWRHFATSTDQQVHAILGGIFLAIATIAFRRRKNSRVTVDCPPGERVTVRIGNRDDYHS